MHAYTQSTYGSKITLKFIGQCTLLYKYAWLLRLILTIIIVTEVAI